MSPSWPPALVLWDVDHTLVDAGGFGRALYEMAFRAVTGQPLDRLAEMTGRTDQAILADTLALNGQPADDVQVGNMYEALGAAAASTRHQLQSTGRALDGAQGAIDALAEAQALQSVVTGNIRSIAEVKLGAFDLAARLDLDVGGYGSDGHDRAGLVRAAWERARVKYGIDVGADRVFVIGDTPHDIVAAHDAGVSAIGVATGSSTVDELAALNPKAVLGDLTGVETLLRVVLGLGRVP